MMHAATPILRACVRWHTTETDLKAMTDDFRGHMRCVEGDQHTPEGEPLGYQSPPECQGPDHTCDYHEHEPDVCAWCNDVNGEGSESKTLKRTYRSMINRRNRARRKLLLLIGDDIGGLMELAGLVKP